MSSLFKPTKEEERANRKREQANAETIKQEFKAREKNKALTQAERLDRIEKLLGLQV